MQQYEEATENLRRVGEGVKENKKDRTMEGENQPLLVMREEEVEVEEGVNVT